MQLNESDITFDHMENEKSRPLISCQPKRLNFFELTMFLAEEALAIIILFSMFFLL